MNEILKASVDLRYRAKDREKGERDWTRMSEGKGRILGKCFFIFISVRMGVTFQSLLHIMNIGDIMYRLCCDYIQYFYVCLKKK